MAFLVGVFVVGLRREERVPADAGGDGAVAVGGGVLRVLRSRGGGAAAVDVDHVADLDSHRAHALLLVSLAAQDLNGQEESIRTELKHSG